LNIIDEKGSTSNIIMRGILAGADNSNHESSSSSPSLSMIVPKAKRGRPSIAQLAAEEATKRAITAAAHHDDDGDDATLSIKAEDGDDVKDKSIQHNHGKHSSLMNKKEKKKENKEVTKVTEKKQAKVKKKKGSKELTHNDAKVPLRRSTRITTIATITALAATAILKPKKVGTTEATSEEAKKKKLSSTKKAKQKKVVTTQTKFQGTRRLERFTPTLTLAIVIPSP
jgi:hypothetical protein